MKTEQEIEEKLKRTEQENKRLLETINAKPLETVDMDSAFEIEKLKDQLQAKEQECENLKEKIAQIKCEEIGKETFFEYKIKNYKQVLDEIENYVRDNSDFDKSDKLTSNTGAYDILEIINKEKDK